MKLFISWQSTLISKKYPSGITMKPILNSSNLFDAFLNSEAPLVFMSTVKAVADEKEY
jgi:hypothetical protein